jgi:hypothetical protein
MSASNGKCHKCRRYVEEFGSRWCEGCYYPGIEQDYARFHDLREEGYLAREASLMVGWSDPQGEKGP